VRAGSLRAGRAPARALSVGAAACTRSFRARRRWGDSSHRL